MGDLLEERFGILVPGPKALEVEDADTTQPADLHGRGRADDAVHGRCHQRQVEAEGVDLPGDVHVLGITSPPAGHDGDVVKPVRPAPRLTPPDLDFCHGRSSGDVRG
jgi:hypothetical protein